jgi:hypothetical protein
MTIKAEREGNYGNKESESHGFGNVSKDNGDDKVGEGNDGKKRKVMKVKK